jgi:hypothetical protein
MEKTMGRLAEAFLDAAFAIALSAPGDQFHAKARELAEQMERDATLTTDDHFRQAGFRALLREP